MKLHIVSGFLGSGKTTSIIQAAKSLMDTGQVVGVITNDQGRYLVDSAFFRLQDVPTVEVTGGCFCCNYDDLDVRLNQLIAASHPDVIFAESVGSCADVIATVVRPLLTLGQGTIVPTSFSVFADARLLRRRLLDLEMPFSEDVVYIFDKQLEEAGLVVINKTDLLTAGQVAEVQVRLSERFPGKPVLAQSAIQPHGTRAWLEKVQAGGLALPAGPLDIDYDRYAEGERRLAWLDQEITLGFSSGEGQKAVRSFIQILLETFEQRGAGIGHLKFILSSDDGSEKLSFPAINESGWEDRIPWIAGSRSSLLVNARVEMAVEDLQSALLDALNRSGIDYSITKQDSFHPASPNPAHRIR